MYPHVQCRSPPKPLTLLDEYIQQALSRLKENQEIRQPGVVYIVFIDDYLLSLYFSANFIMESVIIFGNLAFPFEFSAKHPKEAQKDQHRNLLFCSYLNQLSSASHRISRRLVWFILKPFLIFNLGKIGNVQIFEIFI